jgi:hypothetical protein
MSWYTWALFGFGSWLIIMAGILAFLQSMSDPMDEEYRERWH